MPKERSTSIFHRLIKTKKSQPKAGFPNDPGHLDLSSKIGSLRRLSKGLRGCSPTETYHVALIQFNNTQVYMRNQNSAHRTAWLEKRITRWFLLEPLQSFKFSSFYSSSTRWFMLDKIVKLKKEEVPISAMHFWTPTSSLKDISIMTPNPASQWSNNQKVSRSISPSVSELVSLRGDKRQISV